MEVSRSKLPWLWGADAPKSWNEMLMVWPKVRRLLVTYARRKDTTHKAIAEGLLAAGFSVADTSRLGDDFPDLVIGKWGVDAKVECKSDRKIHKQKGDGLSAGQKLFKDQWKGAPVIVAKTFEDVIWAFNMLMKRNHWSK